MKNSFKNSVKTHTRDTVLSSGWRSSKGHVINGLVHANTFTNAMRSVRGFVGSVLSPLRRSVYDSRLI